MFLARSIDLLIVKRLTIKQGHALCACLQQLRENQEDISFGIRVHLKLRKAIRHAVY